MLKLIGSSTYGKHYSFKGAFSFQPIDLSETQWGDTIKDCNGKGQTMCVNECSKCGLKYLASMVVFTPSSCDKCYRNSKFNFNEEY